jgi:hypothetical protein
MRNLIITIVTAVAFLLGYALGNAGAPDPFDQDTFPCQEDELLGYTPDASPNRVACIHIDTLEDKRE